MAYGVEKRRYERLNFYCDLIVTTMPEGESFSASSIDLSLGGVGVSSPRFLNRDQIVKIDFHLRDENHREIVESAMGRVAYSRSDEDGTRLGVEFLQLLQENDNPALAKRLQRLVND
jgi:c-di-GMP-binding flagellar brake protein YcgR